MKSKIIVILIVGFAVAAGVSSYFGRVHLAEELNAKAVYAPAEALSTPVTVTAILIPLNSEDASQATVGELTFVKGWVLTSENGDFGGWSGLVVQNDTLVAINDQGNWLEASLDIHREVPIDGAYISLFDAAAEGADKISLDAESLVALPDGYLVGFEQQHRLMKVSAVGETAMLYETGVDLTVLSNNSGLEAVAELPGGRLLMFAESGRDTQGRTPVWLVSGGGNKALDFRPPENYAATDAAALPNGDILLLMRSYSLVKGARAQIRHITAAEIESGVIVGRQIAEIKKPLNVDNMEGLDIQVLPDGTIRLFLISDDNFNQLQRTLFMVFDWAPEAKLAQHRQ